MRIAIIGGGVSGLVAAYSLEKMHDVVLFEKEGRCGGHAYTVDVSVKGRTYTADFGFSLFERKTFPRFSALLDDLGVPTFQPNMTFGCYTTSDSIGYVVKAKGIPVRAATARSVLSGRLLRLVAEKWRFDKMAEEIDTSPLESKELYSFVRSAGFSESFYLMLLNPLVAMMSALPKTESSKVSAGWFIRSYRRIRVGEKFVESIRGGSREYVNALVDRLRIESVLNADIASVERVEGGVKVRVASAEHDFDQVIFAVPPGEALRLLSDASDEEREVLGGFRYSSKDYFIHADARFMPPNQRYWASRNYFADALSDEEARITYWQSNIFGYAEAPHIFLSTEAGVPPREDLIYARTRFSHPIPDGGYAQRQAALANLQGRNEAWFCGAYTRGTGWHEDAIESAVDVAEQLSGRFPLDV